MDEIWRDIKNYEGLYQVSNKGRVKSLNYNRSGKERILKPRKASNGYLQVGLVKEGERKWYCVHRLVLSTFNPNPDMENLEVNHLDENKENNMLDNLEWVTHKSNCNHGTRNKRVAEKLRGRTLSEETKQKLSESLKGRTLSEETKQKMSISIVQIDASKNKVVNVWGSSHEAKREGGFNPGAIIQCCKNKFNREGNNIYKNYKWQYLHEYIHNIDSRIKKVILFGKEYVF